MRFATKFIWQYPSHLRHVATLPWQTFGKSVKIWQSCREFKGGNFFLRHSVQRNGWKHVNQLFHMFTPESRLTYSERPTAGLQRYTAQCINTHIQTQLTTEYTAQMKTWLLRHSDESEFNIPLDTSNFRDEPFQPIKCTGTDNWTHSD